MLQSPKSGDNILTWAKNATKEINSNTIHNGIGIKVLRTPQGTNISVQPSAKSKGSSPVHWMPFDCQLVEHEDDSLSFEVHVLCGKLFYAIENGVVEIPPEDLIGKDYWDLDLTLADNLTIGIQCNYDSESETQIPESFTVGEIPYDPYNAQEGWLDADGMHCFPLVRFIKIGPNQTYSGPSIFSIQVPKDNGSQGTEEEEEFDTYYAIQSHHGDVYFDNNDCAAWIGEVRNGSNGSYYVVTVDGSGTSSTMIHAVELAGSCTFPYGSRVIVHRIMTESLASGDYGSNEEE